MTNSKAIKLIVISIVLVISIIADHIVSNTPVQDPSKIEELKLNMSNTPVNVRTRLTTTVDNISVSNSESSEITAVYNAEDKLSINNYTKISIGYSPIVSVWPMSVWNNRDKNFAEQAKSNGNTNSYYTTNLKKIIDAVIESTDGKLNLGSLGFEGGSKNTRLSIPDSTCAYRREVIDYLAFLISDGKGVTKSNKAEVKQKLSILLSKVENVANPISIISSTENYRITLVPEYMLNERKTNCINTVYDINNYGTVINVYMRKIQTENYRERLNTLKNSNNLFDITGIRSMNGENISKKDCFKYSPIYIDCYKNEVDLREYLGDTYYK